VASLLYQESFTCEEIVEVPIVALSASNTKRKGDDATDIFKFSTMYSETSSDDDDDNGDGTDRIARSSECDATDKECPSDITREQLNCSLIECAIGNRLFQFTATSHLNSSKAEFIEVVHKEKMLQRVSGFKRKQ
jgi:hypothetical protein